MKCAPGLLGVACACLVMLVEGWIAKQTEEKCSLKELAALTQHRVQESLRDFNKANGGHLGTWSPGFPQLKVDTQTPFNGPNVQCSLTFMAQGLEKILEDQKKNLNPTDVSLHRKLHEAISKVRMLKACVENFYEGKCSAKQLPPKMPQNTFKKKQWSHTLLISAKEYLIWLQHKIRVSKTSEIKQKKFQAKSSGIKYLKGSAYHL